MRLIDADALMREFADFVRASNNSDFEDVPTWNDAVSLVGSAPAIEAEPVKHGRWIEVSDGSGYVGEPCEACSVCGMQTDYPSNYCPNCGAKMDGEEMWEEPEINPCRGCDNYDGRGGCKSNGGCGAKINEVEE